MAEPDCGACEAMGFRACDVCGTPVFPDPAGVIVLALDGRELCAYCFEDCEK